MQVLKSGLEGLQDGTEFDLVVIGAGGAGLSAAVFAAIDGRPYRFHTRATKSSGSSGSIRVHTPQAHAHVGAARRHE